MLNPAPLLARGRAAAEALMVDACTVVRQGAPNTNPDTGAVSYPGAATVYSGKCRFQSTSSAGPATASPQELGGAGVLVSTPVLQLPVAVTTVQPDDLVTCTASAHDPGLVGKTWRARPNPRGTHKTKTAVGLVEVSG